MGSYKPLKEKEKLYFIRVYTHFPLGFFLHTIKSIQAGPSSIFVGEKMS